MAETNFAYTEEEGVFLVKLARSALEAIVTKKERLPVPADVPEKLKKESGVFVTLNKIASSERRQGPREHELRGCIGRPMPSQAIVEATRDSAIDAAIHDPRFSPVQPKELGNILVEVTALTPPVLLVTAKPEDRERAIKVGRDGLLIEAPTPFGPHRGLLLPQVPIEWHWDEKEYLNEICYKAGLSPDYWLKSTTKLYTFQGEIFMEETPRGNIVRHVIH